MTDLSWYETLGWYIWHLFMDPLIISGWMIYLIAGVPTLLSTILCWRVSAFLTRREFRIHFNAMCADRFVSWMEFYGQHEALNQIAEYVRKDEIRSNP